MSSKFEEIHEILQKDFTDIFFLSETKLDSSYPNAQFNVSSYTLYRLDRNSHGGGLVCYIKETLPHKIRNDIAVNANGIESLVIHVKSDKVNMFFLHLYKPPNIHARFLKQALESMINMCLIEAKSVIIIGDLNINFRIPANELSDICDTFDLKQIVKNPTCFKSIENPSLLDIILTNCPKSLISAINMPLGISDFHNYISSATRINRPTNEPKIIFYRSFKKFSEDRYKKDLEDAPFHVSQVFEDVDDQMWYHNTLLNTIVDKNAPKKQKRITFKPLPYMNDNLRKAINVKAALRRKFINTKSQESWSKFKKQRNLVNKMKRISLQKYFHDNCNSNKQKGKHFWDIVRPFMSDNAKLSNRNIILYENGKLLNDPVEVCTTFNEYYINITYDITESVDVKDMSVTEVIEHYKDHRSIIIIIIIIIHLYSATHYYCVFRCALH